MKYKFIEDLVAEFIDEKITREDWHRIISEVLKQLDDDKARDIIVPIEVEEVIFDKKKILFHLDLTIPMSVSSLKGLYHRIAKNEYLHPINLYDIEDEDIVFYVETDGKFKDKWCLSLPLSRYGHEKLLANYAYWTDGGVKVLTDKITI